MKSNTNELRKRIKSVLENYAKSYYQEAPSKHKYPYIVFELSEISTIIGKTVHKLEINCISTNNVEVENIADKVQDVLDEYNFSNDKISFYTYRGPRNTVYEEDKSIKRRRLVFELFFYSKEEQE